MNTKRAIGFVLEGMTGPGSGTWSRFESLARGLIRNDQSIHVLASSNLQKALSDIPIASVHVTPEHSKIGRFLNRRSLVENFIRSTSVDVVHIEAPPFPKVFGAKTIASVHDLRYFQDSPLKIRSAEGIYQRIALRRQTQNMDGLAVLGPWAASEVVALLGVDSSRVFVIPPIVEAPKGLKPEPIKSSAGFVLVLGHLENRKNVATILHATESTHWPHGIDLVIAGNDSGAGAHLKTLASKAKCQVKFIGGIDESTKWKLLAGAELVLLPSLIEGFGIVGVEAPLAGTPVLVSDRTALLDIAADPHAIVSALDHEAWAERISSILSSAQIRENILSKQIISAQRFTSHVIVPRVLSVYEQMLSG